MSRTTVLLGAGAAIEIGGPTTLEITNNLLDNNLIFDSELFDNEEEQYYIEETKKSIPYMQEIFGILKKNCHSNLLHFETIFYVAEMLHSYIETWQYGEEAKNYPYVYPPFSFFVKSAENLSKDYYDRDLFFYIYRRFNTVLAYDIAKYNYLEDKHLWYKHFWKNNHEQWDIFTLNYDTTVEQSIKEFEDGFREMDNFACFKFTPEKLFSNSKNLSTISHLHGCIDYGFNTLDTLDEYYYETRGYDLYKYNCLNTAKKTWYDAGTPSNQAVETLYLGPMVTGLNKLEKLNCYPYSSYHAFMHKKVLQNYSLLIVGYSFGDLYLNQLIQRMYDIHGEKRRIVLITYWNNIDLNYGIVTELIRNYGLRTESPMYRFLATMIQDNNWIGHLDKELWLQKKYFYVSENNTVMLIFNGFKHAIENYSQKIYNFLNK